MSPRHAHSRVSAPSRERETTRPGRNPCASRAPVARRPRAGASAGPSSSDAERAPAAGRTRPRARPLRARGGGGGRERARGVARGDAHEVDLHAEAPRHRDASARGSGERRDERADLVAPAELTVPVVRWKTGGAAAGQSRTLYRTRGRYHTLRARLDENRRALSAPGWPVKPNRCRPPATPPLARVEEALARDPRAVTMGAGGDSLTSRRFDAAEVEASAARPSRNVRRRSRLAPTGGKALARRTTSYERIANASYEKLHELADWRRIGLHEKYADETMVRREATIPTPRRSRRASARRSPIGPAAFPPRRARVAGSVLL